MSRTKKVGLALAFMVATVGLSAGTVFAANAFLENGSVSAESDGLGDGDVSMGESPDSEPTLSRSSVFEYREEIKDTEEMNLFRHEERGPGEDWATYFSTDGGETWTEGTENLPNGVVFHDSSTGLRMYRPRFQIRDFDEVTNFSTDFGETWSEEVPDGVEYQPGINGSMGGWMFPMGIGEN